MKYFETEFYSGIFSSCYLSPRYHPGCLGCADHTECYGAEAYQHFRLKAFIMSELLDQSDCLDYREAAQIARAMGLEDQKEKISSILKLKICPDAQISYIVKLSLEIS